MACCQLHQGQPGAIDWFIAGVSRWLSILDQWPFDQCWTLTAKDPQIALYLGNQQANYLQVFCEREILD